MVVINGTKRPDPNRGEIAVLLLILCKESDYAGERLMDAQSWYSNDGAQIVRTGANRTNTFLFHLLL